MDIINKDVNIDNILKDFAELIQYSNFSPSEDGYDNINVISKFLENNYDESAFYIVNIKKIIEKYELWFKHLPRVKPFYAVKCNPNPIITKLLNELNIGFDCASKNEISQIISQGTDQKNIIYANPCKAASQIIYARSENIDYMTFDNINELYKIKLYHPNAKLILRIAVDDSKSICKFNCKFGADIADIPDILSVAKSLQLNVIGISFHVGSNCLDAKTYYNALADARTIFDIGYDYNFKFTLLDIGGGFPGHNLDDTPTFEEIAKEINRGIDDFFDSENINIIAEPGRFFVSSSHTLVANIIGKKTKNNENIYYLNDGIYGSFNCIIFDHLKPIIQPYNSRDDTKYKSIVFGPTCDSIDIISNNCLLPDLAIGEWVYVENFGAYTIAASSNFNGFQQTKCVYCYI
jgi:ornithine decarboxylase